MPKLGDWLDPDDVKRLKVAAEMRAAETVADPTGPVLNRAQTLAWLADRLPNLPPRHTEVCQGLWDRGWLRSTDYAAVPGGIDDYSARILVSALQANRSLLVVMPPSHRKAAPVLLSTIIK